MYPAFGNLTWITPYGAMLAVALIACWWYARRRAAASGVDVSHVDLAVPLVFVAAIIGARLFTYLSPSDANVAGELMQAHHRLRLFGLLLVAPPALLAYCSAAKLSFRTMCDLLALPAVLWLAIVRLGCFMAGCCWGDLALYHPELSANVELELANQIQTLPWLTGAWLGLSFPGEGFAFHQHWVAGLIDSGAEASLPVHATQLYEALGLLLLLQLLRWIETQQQTPGALAACALVIYAPLRFLIEFVRADSALVLGSLTFTQLFCIGLLVICLAAYASMRLATKMRRSATGRRPARGLDSPNCEADPAHQRT